MRIADAIQAGSQLGELRLVLVGEATLEDMHDERWDATFSQPDDQITRTVELVAYPRQTAPRAISQRRTTIAYRVWRKARADHRSEYRLPPPAQLPSRSPMPGPLAGATE